MCQRAHPGPAALRCVPRMLQYKDLASSCIHICAASDACMSQLACLRPSEYHERSSRACLGKCTEPCWIAAEIYMIHEGPLQICCCIDTVLSRLASGKAYIYYLGEVLLSVD